MTIQRYRRAALRAALRATLGTALLTAGIHAAGAVTLTVSMLGSDDPSCGASNSPCRTISQAIANAATGSKIIVGPGRYGDLNGDGDFADPGEENSGVSGKMIVINKSLTLVSRDGAGSTLITNASVANTITVSIEAAGVVFGKRRQGFTVRGGASNSTGLTVAAATTAVQIGGDVVDNQTTLALIDGSGHQVRYNVFGQGTVTFSGSGHLVKNNVAEGGTFATSSTSSGIVLDSNQSLNGSGGNGFDLQGSGHLVRRNVASSNLGGDGFQCSGTCTGLELEDNVARLNNGIGFDLLAGSGHVLLGNLASANSSTGFSLTFSTPTAVTLLKNTASGNDGYGFEFNGVSDATDMPAMTSSAALGNAFAGILVNGNAVVEKSSIYGNAADSTNCGIDKITVSGAVTAQRNFWGAAGGPSPTEPADDVCDNPTSIDASLPAAAEIRVSVQKLP